MHNVIVGEMCEKCASKAEVGRKVQVQINKKAIKWRVKVQSRKKRENYRSECNQEVDAAMGAGRGAQAGQEFVGQPAVHK